jgi:D-alanyl-D-alanine carboxypeptidase
MAPAPGPAAPPPPSRILIDPIARRVLFHERGVVRRRPASLTKLMMLYVLFVGLRAGRYQLTDTFALTEAAARSRGSRLGCATGTILNIEQAIMAVAVASANDVAAAIAERLAGSVPGTVALMNRAANALGLSATRFATPHGIDTPGQVTTARDMALLAARLYVDFPERRHYFGLRSFAFGGLTFRSTNRLLPNYAGMNGMKTGTTPHAGYHLIGSAERDGQHLIAIVMGCATEAARDRETAGLLDFGFAAGAGGAVSSAAAARS